jgi:G6PDH family F420-dependent oxidoreductase
VRIGYWLSSEEHAPGRLVDLAVQAEDEGFETAMISDHFHPWLPEQGQSPFVWGVLGAIAQATTSIEVGTGVTAPVRRLHPAIVAHAAATAASLMPGRFFLGLGSGERLNEHVVGGRWPTSAERREMLEEAIGIITALLRGEPVAHRGTHFEVEHAQLFTVPDAAPSIVLAAAGRRTAALAGRLADGIVGVAPDPDVIDAFEANGGRGAQKRRLAQLHVCVDEDVARARKTVQRQWPIAALEGSALTELPRPQDFEQLAALVSEDQAAAKVVCGADPADHLAAIAAFAAAGFDTVYVHQVGDDQEAFFRFYGTEVIPHLS